MPAETELESLLVRLKGDASNYTDMLHRAHEATVEFGRKVIGALEALGVERLLHSAAEAFMGRETGIAKLNATLEMSGQNVDKLRGRYKEFAAEVAHSTMVSQGDAIQLLRTAGRYGLFGDAAERATKAAIGFAEITDQDASSVLRLSAMIEKGQSHLAMHMARHMAPELRDVKNPEEFQAKFTQLAAAGMKAAETRSMSLEGQLHHLSSAWKQLKGDLGATVAQGLTPAVTLMQVLVGWLRRVSPETKATAVQVAAAGAAFLALGPALRTFRTVLGPVEHLLMQLVSPTGLLIAGVATAVAAVLHFTGTGGAALDWFRGKWADLSEDAAKGIGGVQDAVKAGKLELAFEIAWLQVQLTFHKATQELQQVWIDVTTGFKVVWNEVTTFLQKLWNEFTSNFKKGTAIMEDLWGDFKHEVFGGSATRDITGLSDRFANAEKDRISKNKEIEEAHRKANERIYGDRIAGQKAIEDRLNELTVKRDKKAAEAAKEAAKVVRNNVSNLPPVPVKAEVKLDAAAFHSVEAMARVASFRAVVAGAASSDVPAQQLEVAKNTRDLLRDRLPKNWNALQPADFG